MRDTHRLPKQSHISQNYTRSKILRLKDFEITRFSLTFKICRNWLNFTKKIKKFGTPFKGWSGKKLEFKFCPKFLLLEFKKSRNVSSLLQSRTLCKNCKHTCGRVLENLGRICGSPQLINM